MHQNLFWLGLSPRPHWRCLQRFPDPLAGIKGIYFYGKEKGAGKERGEEGGNGTGREKRDGRRREGRGRE